MLPLEVMAILCVILFIIAGIMILVGIVEATSSQTSHLYTFKHKLVWIGMIISILTLVNFGRRDALTITGPVVIETHKVDVINDVAIIVRNNEPINVNNLLNGNFMDGDVVIAEIIPHHSVSKYGTCLLYTSDAADEL